MYVINKDGSRRELTEEEYNAQFKHTPRPRDLNDIELDKFNLRYYGGKPIDFSFETTGIVWATAQTDKDTYYRFYACGTNNLKILKYNIDKDEWLEVQLSEVPNLYSIMWMMCLRLHKVRIC